MKHLTNAASPDSDSHHTSESLPHQMKPLGETLDMVVRKHVETDIEHAHLTLYSATCLHEVSLIPEAFALQHS